MRHTTYDIRGMILPPFVVERPCERHRLLGSGPEAPPPLAFGPWQLQLAKGAISLEGEDFSL